jgi:coenzyme F420-dependent glucose-6-phosphate dehydrogenase
MLKLGYKASAEQFGPRDLIEFGVAAEQSGFDSVFMSDHFQPWRHNGGHSPFALSCLSALGERTNRILIGTSVLTPTFRYPPAVVAQAFGTLGKLYPGRIALGIGTGESMNETPATGLVWPEQRERTMRFREAIRLIGTLWSEDRVNFRGEFYTTENATIYDRPETPIPIYIAAAGPLMARLAGETAQGFICTSGKQRQLYTETLLPNLAAGLDRASRPQNDIDRMIEMKVSFDPDLGKARENTRYWGALALSAEEKMSVEDPIEMERLADALPVDRTASRWIVSSDPDEHVERIGEYVLMGFNHLVFHAPGHDQQEFISRYSREILPRIRRAFT